MHKKGNKQAEGFDNPFQIIVIQQSHLVNSDLADHASALVRGAVEAVSAFLDQGHRVGLSRGIEQVLLRHGDLRGIHAGRNFVIIEHHVVGEPRVVLEDYLFARSNGEAARLENQTSVRAAKQDVNSQRIAG